MREIIFRAWDGKKLSIGKAEYFDDSVNFRFEHFDIDCDKPILEQYTGLKDKNGKMIFDGDVVFAGFGEYYQGTHEHRTTIIIDMSNYDALNALCNANVVEVIGNIHDQKEDL